MAARRSVPKGPPPPPDWKFNAFPTYFALATGMMSGILVGFYGGGTVFTAAFILSLFGFTFGVAHIVGRTVVSRRIAGAAARAEDDERDRREYAARAAAAANDPTPPRRRRKRR